MPHSPNKSTPIRSRGAARTLLALAAVLIASVGIWGAFATFTGFRDYDRSKRLESGYEQMRYALALERSALRGSNAWRAQQQLAAASGEFANGLTVATRSGAPASAVARRFGTEHVELSHLAAGAVGYPEHVRKLDGRMSSLDTKLTRVLTAIREQNETRWPGQPIEKFALAAIALLLALGLAACGVVLVRLVGYRRRLARARRDEVRRLSEAALTDSLTGLGNLRSFHEDLEREIGRRERSGSSFSIVMLDLNGLKQINDTLGHQAGDASLRALGECLRATVRASDSAYRIGGDELMVLLPDERAWGAFAFAQRLLREASVHRSGITFSGGIAEASDRESADTLVRRADLALYEAKRSGRRVVIYAEGLAPKPAAPAEERASRHHQRLLATALARAVDAKDVGTRNHCETVSELCALIGEELGLDADRLERLRLAGLLHDVGKIGVADGILRKAGPLTAEETAAMSGHVHVGHSVVEAAELEEEARWVLHHHEHVDGSGYPDGLRGEEIPLESRIILVADAFEAMTADRPYSPAVPVDQALAELDSHAGNQFDPACVKALRSAIAADDEIDPQAHAA